ncbi:hypothetical protein HNP38_003577 [Chryseobacterium defluvii]|uniref:Signal peptidase n=1 Tax=Chryseobacterium defluvii TaxID=160396 RepID=A0A840KGE9_9FLAO|nr:signal peptidase [Chryseobacterium defluvii]MBB4808236.1 hypothetical protein [Chryseobacterium defluvii]
MKAIKTINKLVPALFLFAFSLVNAEDPPAPYAKSTGGSGTGSPASPIDMYIYIFSVVAIMFIVYYTKRYKSQKV